MVEREEIIEISFETGVHIPVPALTNLTSKRKAVTWFPNWFFVRKKKERMKCLIVNKYLCYT